MKRISIFVLIIFSACYSADLFGQSSQTNGLLGGDDKFKDKVNTITTAVPFLMIAPDSRAGAMGDAGVATTPDANSLHWNPAKYSFIEKDAGVAISYVPWLRKLVSDINLAHISGYKKMKNNQVLSGSLVYFTLGEIQFTNMYGEQYDSHKPSEFGVDVAYSRLLTEKLSGSVALRFIYSDLTGNKYVLGSQTERGKSYAGDVSFYYQDDLIISERKSRLALGMNISNIGSKISYSSGNVEKDFIPTNFRLGGALSMEIDDYNKFMFALDFNKLLVPTMPVYYEPGEITPDGDTIKTGNEVVQFGMDPNVALPVGMVHSFYDAPGVQLDAEDEFKRSVFKEEMREINTSIGMEYWYADQFAIRAGYFHEHATKGNRQYFTIGLGLRLNVFGLDFSYLVPTKQRNPLENTLRFTLIFDFEGLRQETTVPN